MRWEAVNVFAFFPPLLAIFQLAISSLTKGFLRRRVQDFVAGKRGLGAKEDVIRNIAAGWATLQGFFTTLFAALFSVFSIYSRTKSFEWTVLTLAILLLVFIPMFWWLLKYQLDEVEALQVSPRWAITPGRVCKWVLLGVNVLLLAAIAVSQQLSPPAPASPP
jgi:hypothetical protein